MINVPEGKFASQCGPAAPHFYTISGETAVFTLFLSVLILL